MADNDGDSHMDSPPDLSDTEENEPLNSLLSPPESQSQTQTLTSTSTMSNSNGKRPLNTISNGTDTLLSGETRSKTRSTPAQAQDFPPRTHAASGYTWSRHEDEPGYAWSNKKALDERQRAWEGLVHKELMVRSKSCLPD